jgi:hypothetical protein
LDTVALVDADLLLWKFAAVNEKSITWEPGVVSEVLDLDRATRELTEWLKWLKKKIHASELWLCFTNSRNFRYKVSDTYKQNRVGKEAPKLFKEVKSFLWSNYDCRSQEMLEADDFMGIYGSTDPEKYVVCTLDKDLSGVPCTIFNWKKSDKPPRRITVAEANFYFFRQTLSGDPTDGFKGVPGIGPKKAERILDGADLLNEEECWQRIIETYAKAGMSEQEALTQAHLARILRCGEFDFKRKEVKLWTPKRKP